MWYFALYLHAVRQTVPQCGFKIPEYQIHEYQIPEYQIHEYQIPEYKIPEYQRPEDPIPIISKAKKNGISKTLQLNI